MAGEPPKPKLTLKQTDTSRLKTDTGRIKTDAAGQPAKPVLPPGAEAPPPAPAAAPQQTVRLTDPMDMRDTDTTRLRRVSPEGDKAATGAAVAPGTPSAPAARKPSTETVRLKVVREQKQTPIPAAAGTDAAPSQTARLRPPVLPAKPTAAPPPPPPAAQTVSIKAPVLDAAKTQPAAPAEDKTSTSRLQRVGAPATPATPPPPIASPGEGGAHQTVKIKLPVLDDAGSQEPAATAVLPPPDAGPGAATVRLDAESPADAVPKKTIKLRMSPKTEGLPAPVRDATAAATMSASAAAAAATAADPLSLAAAIVTVLGLAAMVVMLAMQVAVHVL
jgi:hypothetical protein